MAEQIPYGVAESLFTKLGSVVFHEIGLMYGVGDELRKLEDTLSTVRAVLVDAEEKKESNQAVAVWVGRLKEVVYDADDLLDDFATEVWRRKIDVRGRCRGQVSDFFSSSNHLAFRFKMGHRIKAIRERLDDVANDISKFNLISRVVISDHIPVKSIRGRETCSVVEKSHKIVGRDEAKKHIIELLMQSTSQENLSTVGIVGMGGLGKTTLAQLAYNDKRVLKHFDLTMWVCASNDFDVKILIRKVIKSATNSAVEEDLELEQLQQILGKNLDGKRYLLVLDDVWNEDAGKWGQFITLLPAGANGGSKILVTTRSTKVTSVMGINFPYIMEGLKDDESWELFESLAFMKGEEKMDPNLVANLVAIGKDIVKMCAGVPLVIRTLGRVLRYKTEVSYWLSIKNNKNLMLLGDKNDVLHVLRLSYDNLPIHLKQCFAYCALFPKNYIFRKRELVQLWMAQGYIQPSLENGYCLENVGNEYFEDLLSWSLFKEAEVQDVIKDILSYKVRYLIHDDKLGYKMHDLVHDLVQSIANSEVIILTDDVKAIPKTVHHVSLFGATNEVPEDLMDKPIRTYFMECDSHGYHLKSKYISSLKCSRVMKVGFIQQIPTFLANLSHLRYLDLSYGSFVKLPSAVTRLKHLQTLKLFNCESLRQWPSKMKKLINLRHLEIDEWNRVRYMPCGLGELTQLQTLPLFWVRNEDRHKKRSMGGLSELKFLDNLRGQLQINGLSGARGTRTEAKEAILEGKQYLESLGLHWIGFEERKEEEEEEEDAVVSVMESLQPHKNLKKLSIKFYGGVIFPNWMMNNGLDLLLPNLVRITLWGCERCQVLPPFGQLPSLQYLELRDIRVVEYMMDYPSSSSASAKSLFPSLKTLYIYKMPRSSSNGWGKRPDVAAHEQPPPLPSYPDLEDLRLSNTTAELCIQLIVCASSSLKSLEISDVKDLSVVEYMKELDYLSSSANPSLKRLTIANMPCSSSYDVAAHDHPPPPPPYPHLEDLRLSNITVELCLQLIICASSSLKSLQISDVKDHLSVVEYMKELDCLSSAANPPLKRLTIANMPCSSSNDVAAHDQPLPPPSYPYLEDLQLSNITAELCLQLIIGASSSLKSLKISDVKDLPSVVEYMKELHCLSLSANPSLKRLTIANMPCSSSNDVAPHDHPPPPPSYPYLEDLQLSNITAELCLQLIIGASSSLKSLKISDVKDLPSVVEYMKELDCLSRSANLSLKRLTIANMPCSSSNDVAAHDHPPPPPPSYPYLEDLQMSNITAELCLQLIICASSSLKSLKILNVKDLISLPPLGLQHLSPLQTLSISRCENLANLPDSIGCLTSLRELEITSCPKLTSLPKEIRSLWNLRTLEIRNCLYLSPKYRKRVGPDWSQISHIPNIIIR